MASKSLFAFNIKVFKFCGNVHLNQNMGIISNLLVYVSLIITILHELSLIADLFINGIGDFQRFCEDTPMTMAFFMVAYEFYNVVTKKNKIEALLRHIQITIDEYQPSYGKSSYKKSQMGHIADKLDKFGFYNLLFGVFTAAMWALRPLITSSEKLPFGNPWFPFDDQKYYYFLWFCHAYIGTCAAVDTINIHLLYAKIMAVISEQFDILNHCFKVFDKKINAVEKRGFEEEIFQRVKQLTRYHQKILICCDDLQECMSGILVCQFCFGISLCFSALATFSISAFSGAFFNLMNHMLIEISELYIYCWFSHKLTESSEMVTEGIFYSNWYIRAPKTKRMLRFVIMRCRKPVVIKAAILPVSITSYIWILQQSYSIFMVLRQVRSKGVQ